jgi:hypothetical protein
VRIGLEKNMEDQALEITKPKVSNVVSFARRQKVKKLLRRNVKFARKRWGNMTKASLQALSQLTEEYCLSVEAGQLQIVDGHWYVTHSGLLRVAFVRKCAAIKTVLENHLSDPSANRWIFRAVVYKSSKSKGFVGYGDADPSNVSLQLRGAEMRVAETRAVNRALRKAYGIGICSVEELGASATSNRDSDPYRLTSASAKHSNNGQPRLRDQLCVLIRQHNLDPALVKAYAADFCGTATLSGASRDLVESFISHLSSTAKENRDSLVCKLNSYAQSVEARP